MRRQTRAYRMGGDLDSSIPTPALSLIWTFEFSGPDRRSIQKLDISRGKRGG